jgi:DNA-binding HxlR family transcriptional regulator
MAGRKAVENRESIGGRQSMVGSRGSVAGNRKSAAAGQSETRKKSPLELDRLIHERLRLGIVSALAVNERLTFNDLKRLLRTTDGNLSVHARKLEDAQYVSCEKSFQGRMPRTEYTLTAAGRRALEKYLTHMESIIQAVRD